jgi:hypothetical protein
MEKKGRAMEKKGIKLLTVKEALAALASWDHAFITPPGATKVAGALGVPAAAKCYYEVNRPDQFKGLNVPGKKVGEKVYGVAAHILAENICQKLGVEYPQMLGKGFQLRACVEKLQRHFGVA